MTGLCVEREGTGIGKGMPAPILLLLLLRRFAPFWVAIPPSSSFCKSSSMNIMVLSLVILKERKRDKVELQY